MTIIVILVVMAALASAVVGAILGLVFFAMSAVLPPAVVFGLLAAAFAFPFFYGFFARNS